MNREDSINNFYLTANDCNYIQTLNLMGNSDSKDAGIMLKHQNIQDWLKVEDQGHCQLWINKRTGRHFKAYSIPEVVITDPQQLERYAFRKAHDNHIVTVEGVLGQGEGFLCTQPRSSFVLVENITSRISDHSGEFTFEQALYVLYASATGYNTLNSFFGPLEPHEDMICINDQGRVKVWLNQNLASNNLSRSAKINENGNNHREFQASDYTLAKRRIRQSVLKLFWIVERTLYQGYPLNFKEESKNVSTYFEVVNFVEYFSEQHGIRIPESIPRAIRTYQIPRQVERPPVIIVQQTQQVLHPFNQPIFTQKVNNLETSRINNIVYRSTVVRDGISSPLTMGSHVGVERSMIAMDRSKSDIGIDHRSALAQSTIVPRVNFQIRPSMIFQQPQQPVRNFGQPPIGRPIITSLLPSNQPLNFPPPKVVYATSVYTQQVVIPLPKKQQPTEPIMNSDQQLSPQISKETQLQQPEPQNNNVQVHEDDNIADDEEVERQQQEHGDRDQQIQSPQQTKVEVNHECVIETNQPTHQQKPLQLQDDENPVLHDQEAITHEQQQIEHQPQHQQNIYGTQFTFNNELKQQSLIFTLQGQNFAEYPQYPERQEEEEEDVPQYPATLMQDSVEFIPQYPGALLQGSVELVPQYPGALMQNSVEFVHQYPGALLQGSVEFQEQNIQGQNYQDAYEVAQPSSNKENYTTADKFVPPQKYRLDRSPILEQDQNCPPTPQNDKGAQIQQWQAQLNRYTNSSRHSRPASKEDNHQEQSPKKQQKYKVRNPESKVHLNDSTKPKDQKSTNQMAELDYQDIEKYIRMKYQHYLNEPEAPSSQKQMKSYKQPYKSQIKKEEVRNYEYKYTNPQPELTSWKKTKEYPCYEPVYEPVYENPSEKENKYNIDKQNYHPNQYSTTQYDYNYDEPAYKSNYDSAFPDTGMGKTSTQYISELGQYYAQDSSQHLQFQDEYIPPKYPQKAKKRNIDMTNIDEKYNKYVLNSKKISKPAVTTSGRGLSSWEVSMIFPGDESKITRQELKPILESFQRSEKRIKTSEFGAGSEKNDSANNSKKVITYDKLRTLLWEQ